MAEEDDGTAEHQQQKKLDQYQRAMNGRWISLCAVGFQEKEIDTKVDVKAMYRKAQKRLQQAEHPRILVIMQNRFHAAGVAVALQRFGCLVAISGSGRDAQRRYLGRNSNGGKPIKFDLCIVQWNLPDMDGRALIYYNRKDGGKLCFLAALSPEDTAEEALRHGADLFLRMPLIIHMHQLRELLLPDIRKSYQFPAELVQTRPKYEELKVLLESVTSINGHEGDDALLTEVSKEIEETKNDEKNFEEIEKMVNEMKLSCGHYPSLSLNNSISMNQSGAFGAAFISGTTTPIAGSYQQQRLRLALKSCFATFQKMKNEMAEQQAAAREQRLNEKHSFVTAALRRNSILASAVETLSLGELRTRCLQQTQLIESMETEKRMLQEDLKKVLAFRMEMEDNVKNADIVVNLIEHIPAASPFQPADNGGEDVFDEPWSPLSPHLVARGKSVSSPTRTTKALSLQSTDGKLDIQGLSLSELRNLAGEQEKRKHQALMEHHRRRRRPKTIGDICAAYETKLMEQEDRVATRTNLFLKSCQRKAPSIPELFQRKQLYSAPQTAGQNLATKPGGESLLPENNGNEYAGDVLGQLLAGTFTTSFEPVEIAYATVMTTLKSLAPVLNDFLVRVLASHPVLLPKCSAMAQEVTRILLHCDVDKKFEDISRFVHDRNSIEREKIAQKRAEIAQLLAKCSSQMTAIQSRLILGQLRNNCVAMLACRVVMDTRSRFFHVWMIFAHNRLVARQTKTKNSTTVFPTETLGDSTSSIEVPSPSGVRISKSGVQRRVADQKKQIQVLTTEVQKLQDLVYYFDQEEPKEAEAKGARAKQTPEQKKLLETIRKEHQKPTARQIQRRKSSSTEPPGPAARPSQESKYTQTEASSQPTTPRTSRQRGSSISPRSIRQQTPTLPAVASAISPTANARLSSSQTQFPPSFMRSSPHPRLSTSQSDDSSLARPQQAPNQSRFAPTRGQSSPDVPQPADEGPTKRFDGRMSASATQFPAAVHQARQSFSPQPPEASKPNLSPRFSSSQTSLPVDLFLPSPPKQSPTQPLPPVVGGSPVEAESDRQSVVTPPVAKGTVIDEPRRHQNQTKDGKRKESRVSKKSKDIVPCKKRGKAKRSAVSQLDPSLLSVKEKDGSDDSSDGESEDGVLDLPSIAAQSTPLKAGCSPTSPGNDSIHNHSIDSLIEVFPKRVLLGADTNTERNEEQEAEQTPPPNCRLRAPRVSPDFNTPEETEQQQNSSDEHSPVAPFLRAQTGLPQQHQEGKSPTTHRLDTQPPTTTTKTKDDPQQSQNVVKFRKVDSPEVQLDLDRSSGEPEVYMPACFSPPQLVLEKTEADAAKGVQSLPSPKEGQIFVPSPPLSPSSAAARVVLEERRETETQRHALRMHAARAYRTQSSSTTYAAPVAAVSPLPPPSLPSLPPPRCRSPSISPHSPQSSPNSSSVVSAAVALAMSSSTTQVPMSDTTLRNATSTQQQQQQRRRAFTVSHNRLPLLPLRLPLEGAVGTTTPTASSRPLSESPSTAGPPDQSFP